MKDSNILPDIQLSRDSRGVELNKVGVSSVTMPLTMLKKNGELQRVTATANICVHLDAALKGTHMSRFITNLAEQSNKHREAFELRSFLLKIARELHTDRAEARLAFGLSIDKPAPVSKLSAPMSYDVVLHGRLNVSQKPHVFDSMLEVTVPISTLCPCSKAISEHGAHNQRTNVKVKLNLDIPDESQTVWVEDIVELIDGCASCPVYPLLKRADEKYVTERQYENPKFVEDVARDVVLSLREVSAVAGFSVEVESLESIHGHNAFTCHSENFVEF